MRTFSVETERLPSAQNGDRSVRRLSQTILERFVVADFGIPRLNKVPQGISDNLEEDTFDCSPCDQQKIQYLLKDWIQLRSACQFGVQVRLVFSIDWLQKLNKTTVWIRRATKTDILDSTGKSGVKTVEFAQEFI